MKTKLLKIIIPVLPVNLILAAVVWWELRGENGIWLWAFFAGLVADLVSGRTLGLSSLFYLGVLSLINLIKTRQKFNVLHAVLIIIIFDFVYGWLPV